MLLKQELDSYHFNHCLKVTVPVSTLSLWQLNSNVIQFNSLSLKKLNFHYLDTADC